MSQKKGLLLIRFVTALALVIPAAWMAWVKTPIPLLLLIGTVSALLSIHIGQASEVRYGERIIVTQMIPVGREKKDHQLILGGLAGYLMLLCFSAALWFAF